MPFMKGPAPVRRTLEYLEKGIVLRNAVRLFLIHFNSATSENHKGAQDFVFWHVGQLQYKNPDVQVVYLRDMTPTPFIRCWLDSGRQILMDVDGKSKDDILAHVRKILGKPEHELAKEAKQQEINPGYFGADYTRFCICEVPGQVPCPGIVPLPKHMRGKYKNADEE